VARERSSDAGILKTLAIWLVVGAAVACIPFGLKTWGYGPIWPAREQQLDLIRQLAEPLPRALEAYRSDNGAYPQKLEHLVPGYLPQIPALSPVAVEPWRYCRSKDGTDYALSIELLRDFDPRGIHFACTLAYRLDGQHPKCDHGGPLVWHSGRWGFYSE